jgi:acetylglutamate kinase
MAFSHDDLLKTSKDIDFYTDNENKIESVYFNKAQVLVEALPYIKEYFSKIVVVKIGGAMMENDSIMQSVLDDLILMKYVGIKVVLVHGGGKQITELMEQKKIKVEFVDGLRVTTKDTIDVVKMVLMGSINSKIVSFLNKHGNAAVGISGNDGNFIVCKKKIYKKEGRDVDLGFVGEIQHVDAGFITNILENDYIPVIATLGTDTMGNLYNINADTCASEIAVALKAKKMILLTDVDGIAGNGDALKNGGHRENPDKKLISRLSAQKSIDMVESGEIASGMIPKVKACINSLKNGVERTHILNGINKHVILIEIFTDKGIGTMITL